MQSRIAAQFVEVGDTLVGLGDTYVWNVEQPSDLYYGNVIIEFHDREGRECDLGVPADFLIEVKR